MRMTPAIGAVKAAVEMRDVVDMLEAGTPCRYRCRQVSVSRGDAAALTPAELSMWRRYFDEATTASPKGGCGCIQIYAPQ